MKKPIPNTTPIENLVPPERWSREYAGFSRSLPWPRDLVQLHKGRLGKQDTTLQVAEHLMYVWVKPTWTVFVNNAKGVCFEVPSKASADDALWAWRDYKQLMRV